jgi:hypothetical protein
MGFFGKTTVAMDEDISGRAVVFKQTRAMRKSEARLIPATPAPKTAWQKFKRDAWG